jgi:hypothetical protein
VAAWRKKFKENAQDLDLLEQGFSIAAAQSSTVRPPPKPQRTFDHDVYVQGKEEIRVLVDQKFRGKQADVRRNRRRSRSADASIDMMFEPVSAVSRIIRTSFGDTNALYPLTESAGDSDENTHQAAKYARLLRNGIKKGLISHYSAVADITSGARLCMFVTMYDKLSDNVALHPCTSDAQKPDFVRKFLSQMARRSDRDTNDQFCWFAYTDQIFIYSHFIGDANRVIALSSHLFSPRFFSDVLKAIAADSITSSSPISQVAEELISKKIPLPGDTFCLNGWQIEVPWQMPQVSVSQPSLLLTYMEPDVIVKSVATLVQEQRLALVSCNSNLLVDVSKALLSLIYPLAWDYMYWPFVPADLVRMCAAFTLPYLICLHPEQVTSFRLALRVRDQKVLIVDLDERRVHQETGSEDRIFPKQISRSTVKALRLSCTMTDLNDCVRDKAVTEIFNELFCRLLGPVTMHISDHTFSKDCFTKSLKDKDMRTFYTWFSETRLFDNFVKYWQLRVIHYKYVPLSERRVHMDQFERRMEVFSLKSQNKVHPAKDKDVTTGWSSTAMRVVENRMKSLGDRIRKHV